MRFQYIDGLCHNIDNLSISLPFISFYRDFNYEAMLTLSIINKE